MAQTTRDAPCTASPAAKTPGADVFMVFGSMRNGSGARDREVRRSEEDGAEVRIEAERPDDEVGGQHMLGSADDPDLPPSCRIGQGEAGAEVLEGRGRVRP
jgi:hypothetical protein